MGVSSQLSPYRTRKLGGEDGAKRGRGVFWRILRWDDSGEGLAERMELQREQGEKGAATYEP